MTRGCICWLLGLLLTAAAPAWAQREDRPLLQRAGGNALRQSASPPPEEARPQREDLRSRQQGARSQPAGARPDLRGDGGGRMTRDERRQLRRDIGDAGRDLYRREPLRRR